MSVIYLWNNRVVLILLISCLYCSFEDEIVAHSIKYTCIQCTVEGRGRGGGGGGGGRGGRGGNISRGGGGGSSSSNGSSSEYGVVYFFGSWVLFIIFGCIYASCRHVCKKRRTSDAMKSRLRSAQRKYDSNTVTNQDETSQTHQQGQVQGKHKNENKRSNQQESLHTCQIHTPPTLKLDKNPDIWTFDLPVDAPAGYRHISTVSGTTSQNPPDYSIGMTYSTWKAEINTPAKNNYI